MKVILYVILFFIIIIGISTSLSTYINLIEREENKVWRIQHEKELEAVKKYIKIVSKVDIDSVVSNENLYNATFQQLRIEYESSTRGGVYILANE